MKYRVVHRTSYSGHDAVSVGHNQAWLEMRRVDWQRLESFQLTIDPQPSVRTRRIDTFQNPVHLFSFNEGYSKLEITATTVVSVREDGAARIGRRYAWDDLARAVHGQASTADRQALEFAFTSPRISWSQLMRDYAAKSLLPGRDIGEAVVDLASRIRADFEYDNRATTVSTPVSEVFRLRKGVCQDFAHLQIAMLRSLGVPARYVSGYLRTVPPEGQQRLIGSDESHAWLSVYCGDGQWLDLDPTNNCVCGSDHITLAWGRDYSDVPPLTGVFVGGGQHRLTVSVDVELMSP